MLFWHVPAPNEALLISGSKRRKSEAQFRIVTGHGSFVVPIKQKARMLSLALREAEIVEECITNQGIRLNVRAVAAFKVGDDEASIANAARRFLSGQRPRLPRSGCRRKGSRTRTGPRPRRCARAIRS